MVILAKSVSKEKKERTKFILFLVILKVSFKKLDEFFIKKKKEIMDGFLKKEKKAN